MQTFVNWIAENVNNIQIDIRDFENKIKDNITKIVEFSNDKKHELKDFRLNMDIVENGIKNYPKKYALLQAIERENFREELAEFVQWTISQLRSGESTDELRTAYRHLIDYEEYLEGDFEPQGEEEIDEWVSGIIKPTMVNMQKIQQMISESISRIEQWNNSSIVIEATEHYSSYNDIALEPSENAYITIGKGGSFSLFTENDMTKFSVDDILEGGFDEDEFWASTGEKSDYFNLINEIQNPGSTSRGRILTLFTARPQKDRDYFDKVKQLPINLFLTNSPGHADGIAQDFADREGARDVWKVRIDSKYLTQTLDGSIKYYMVTVNNAPVVSMSLY